MTTEDLCDRGLGTRVSGVPKNSKNNVNLRVLFFNSEQLAGGPFLRLGNLCPEAVQTQKSPSGQLPEDRRPEGLGNEKFQTEFVLML